jgi:hypothetical protein
MTPITNSNGQAGTNQAKMKNRTKTASRFMRVQGVSDFVERHFSSPANHTSSARFALQKL